MFPAWKQKWEWEVFTLLFYFLLFMLSILLKHPQQKTFSSIVFLLPVCLLCWSKTKKNLSLKFMFFSPPEKADLGCIAAIYRGPWAARAIRLLIAKGKSSVWRGILDNYNIFTVKLVLSGRLTDVWAWKTRRGPGFIWNTLILEPFWA